MYTNGDKDMEFSEKLMQGRGRSEMELTKSANGFLENRKFDVDKELSRFKQETGYDFLNLVDDNQKRAKFLLDNLDKTDTDEDEKNIQQEFEPYQEKMFKGE